MRFYKLLTLFICIASGASAQFASAVIGIDGLTCSACSYGTERSIRKLDFVKDVKMDLNKNIATITFNDKAVSVDALVEKVYDAGFSVRFVQGVYHFDHPVSIDSNVAMSDGFTFYVLETNSSELSGDVTMHFIADKYVPKKELSKWKKAIEGAQKQMKAQTNAYFVAIP